MTRGLTRVSLLQAHVTTMATRRNSINGRLYREDPTIFAWDLMWVPLPSMGAAHAR